MYPRPRLSLAVTALLTVGFLYSLRVACSQELAPEPGPVEASEPDKTVREQNIYIPYEKLRQVFEKHGRGVFLPYEKFQELWEAAREKTTPPAEQQPPVKALITETENEATVEKDVVKVKALVKIEILAEGWHEIPLRLSDAAITSATLDGQPARIIGTENQGYKLLVEKKGKQPEQIELTLEYAKAITKVPGRNSVSFEAPRAPVSRWRVRIPQSGVKVDIRPLIAAAEEPPADGNQDQPDETVLLAFVGAAPTVRVEWTPKAEGAVGMAAVASVQAVQQVTIDEGVIRTSTRLLYKISRAELSQLVVEVPADHTVVDVVDDNVREWSIEPAGQLQQITAQLYDPAKDRQQVVVKLEKFAGDQPQETIRVPVVKAVGVDRQQGTVLVQIADGLRAEVAKTAGLLQVDKRELDKPLRSIDWAFCYQYATTTPPFDLELGIQTIKPRILVESLVRAYLEPEELTLDLLAIYTVEKAGVFRLEFDVPAGYEVRHVRGLAVAGAEAAAVDSRDLEGDDDTRLVVNLRQKATGRVGLAVRLQKDLDAPDLLAPTGNKTDVPVVLPRVAPDETIHQDSGRLVVYAPESLEVNPSSSEGLRETSVEQALEGMESPWPAQPAKVESVFARAFTQEPVTLMLAARRRRPLVSVRQLLVARIESGVVKYKATFYYEILYSSVKSLRIDVPAASDSAGAEEAIKWRNTSDKIQDTVVEPAEDPPAEGYQAWSFTGETELIGQRKIVLTADYKLKDLDIGKPVKIRVPRLIPRGVDRARGQIVLVKSETIDLDESDAKDEVKGLQGIDPQHDLMPEADVPGAARAFKFDHDWALTAIATQYELEDVKRTSVDRAVLRMVVTRAERISVQALYRIRSARQRIEVKLPGEAAFDTDPVKINGNRVTLQSEKGNYFVPLAGLDSGEPFLLEFRYTVPGDGSRLDLPEFPEKPAVLKVYVCAYLPEEEALLGTTGPWTQEFEWWPTLALDWIPFHQWPDSPDDAANVKTLKQVQECNDRYADYLVSWVCGGLNEPEEFQTDGRLYTFSTLRPSPPPEGSLAIKKMDERLLSVIVFVAVVLGGLLLAPRGIPSRALAVGTLIVALVLCGVFLPTFSLQILDGVLASAIFIVVVIWIAWYLARTRPRQLALRRAAAPPPSPPPSSPPESSESPESESTGPESESTGPESESSEPESESDKGGKTDA